MTFFDIVLAMNSANHVSLVREFYSLGRLIGLNLYFRIHLLIYSGSVHTKGRDIRMVVGRWCQQALHLAYETVKTSGVTNSAFPLPKRGLVLLLFYLFCDARQKISIII